MRSEVRKLPELFLERLNRVIPSQQWDAVANTFAQSKPTSFRVNTLKAGVGDVRAQLEAQGFRLEPVSWYPAAFTLQHGSLRALQQSDVYRQGAIYVQSLSSMIPPLLLNPKPGELVLDLTAAPGSKTTQMACLMRGEGRIVANDNNRVRYYKLRANVEQQAARNVEPMLRSGESIGRTHPGRFDRVLVDAPCSAEGRFQVREPSTYRYWKLVKIREMVRKQKRLLHSAILALRPGGLLVYSTCTFAPEENEGVVSWALSKCGPLIALEAATLPVPNARAGLATWEGQPFHPSLRRAVRILPTPEMEGFFIASIRKHGHSSSGG